MAEGLFRTLNGITQNITFMTQRCWDTHAQKHPEIRGKEKAVQLTVEKPELVVRDPDGYLHKYRSGHGTGKTSGLYLHVLEGQENAQVDHVRTTYFTAQVKRGRTIFPVP